MSRSRLILLVCTGLIFVGTGVQSSRAARFRADAHALRSAAPSLDELNAEIAKLHATISVANTESPDAPTRRVALGKLADELVREVRRTGAELIRLTIEPAGPALALSATGDRFAIARLLSRVDELLTSHAVHVDRFSLAGEDSEGARVDLSVTATLQRWGTLATRPAWPTVNAAAVATALRPARSTRTSTSDSPHSPADSLVAEPPEPATSGGVRWIGTITADGDERYVLRLDQERVVAVLSEGERPVLGWSVLGRERGLLHLSKEGTRYEVHR